jgi:hypothetical protein
MWIKILVHVKKNVISPRYKLKIKINSDFGLFIEYFLKDLDQFLIGLHVFGVWHVRKILDKIGERFDVNPIFIAKRQS